MKKRNLIHAFEEHLNSMERKELNEEQQMLLCSFTGGHMTNFPTNSNCRGYDCTSGCGSNNCLRNN